jgi:hypothetical protein
MLNLIKTSKAEDNSYLDMDTLAETEARIPTEPSPPFLRAIPLLFGRKVQIDRLRAGRDVSLIAAALILGVYFARDWLVAEPARYFSTLGFAPYFTELFCIGAFSYAVSRSAYCALPFGMLLSVLLEVYFFLMLVLTGLFVLQYHYVLDEYSLYFGIFVYVWVSLAILGLLLQALPKRWIRAITAVACFAIVTFVPEYFLEYADYSFWYHDYSSDEDELAAAPIDDYEKIFFSQDSLLQQQLDKVQPGIAGKIEFFYLGFAGYAGQAVFKKEVQYVDRLINEEYSTQQRGLLLINNRETLDTYPLAIQHNLRRALRGIAAKMNADEDILFLYLTSHGSHNHELAVEFEPFQFTDITPATLKRALDHSGIRWKVVIISACYSGGFIEPLQDPYTLIATASDSDHQSFGCSNENDFTYFGEALFRDQLAKGVPLLQALPLAQKAIAEREKREDKTPSNPQLWIGEAIKDYLEKPEAPSQRR